MKLKNWGIPLNNMNVFQRRAQQIQADKFSNSAPVPINSQQPQKEVVEEEVIEPEKNIFQVHAEKNKQKEENKFGFWDTARDIGEQVVSKGLSGVGGAYGNILDAFGLQVPEGKEILPGQEQVYNIQSEILDKMNRGEAPSFSELMLLSDDDLVPNYTRLPNSKQIQKGIESFTGIGEGKTPEGRIAGHGAQFVGEGIATGGGGAKTLLGLAAGGAGGQAIREAGGPEWAASTAEILTPIAPNVITKKLAPLSKTGKDIVEAGRKVGLKEGQIAPLLQSEGNILTKIARKGTRTKNKFASIKESLGDSYNTIKASPQARTKLPNAEQINIRKEFGQIRNELSKTLAPSPDKEAALNYIEKSLETLRNTDVTPEYLVNFWQDINKSVKWNSINGGKKALASLKDPISKTLRKVSPQLAEDFELTNKLYSKYAQISKKLKPDLVDAFFNKGEIAGALPSAWALAFGNPLPLIGLGSEVSARLLASEMLINPYFQTLAGKLVTNINGGSTKAVTNLVKQAREYMTRKYPEQDWSFLTEPQDDED